MKKEVRLSFILLGILILVFILGSTGVIDKIARITGFATSESVTINITISGANNPLIEVVDNQSMTDVTAGPNEGPSTTTISINFTASDADGFTNLDVNKAQINFSLTGEVTRVNSSCANTVNFSTDFANFTCSVTIYWFDGTGTWTIDASIEDTDSNFVSNSTTNFFLGTTDGFVMSPTALTFTGVTAGVTNILSNENITLNNTGNVNKYIEINSTNLRGEINPNLALWANNFTINTASQACEAQALVDHTFVNITAAILNKGNFTIQNLTAGQEEFVTCLEQVGSELTAQSYSTANETAWTIKIVTYT